MKSIARAPRVETVEHLQALLLAPVMAPKRVAPLLSYVRQFLPAAIDVQQNRPNGLTTVVVTCGDDVYRVRSSSAAHVTLA